MVEAVLVFFFNRVLCVIRYGDHGCILYAGVQMTD